MIAEWEEQTEPSQPWEGSAARIRAAAGQSAPVDLDVASLEGLVAGVVAVGEHDAISVRHGRFARVPHADAERVGPAGYWAVSDSTVAMP